MKFINLPEVIFRLLQTILTNDDYHYLLNTSKQHFRDLKRRTIYFRLNEVKSKQYMKDKVFQSYVLSLVEDGWKQIRVNWDSPNFKKWYDRTVPSDCREFVPILENRFGVLSGILPLSSNPRMLKMLQNVTRRDLGDILHLTKLQLISPDDVLDLSLFQHIPDLQISSTTADVTIFNKDHQKRLILTACYNLRNVDSFKGIHILQMTACDNVEDVSPLHGIYDLSFRYCRKIKDISALGNHRRLLIEYRSKSLVGYESLEGIPHVTLIGCDISDVRVLRDAKYVKLQECDNLVDISPLKKVKKVELYQCHHITNITELCNVYDLSIDELVLDGSDVPQLRNYKLSITFFLVGYIDAQDKHYDKYFDDCFSHTSHLSLHDIPVNVRKRFEEGNLSFLKHLQSLTITCSVLSMHSLSIDQSSFRFTKIEGLENIPVVVLDGLYIKSVAGLSNNRCVELRHCKGIEDIESLASVKMLTIDDYEGIYDSNVLSKVPRLKVLETLATSSFRNLLT